MNRQQVRTTLGTVAAVALAASVLVGAMGQAGAAQPDGGGREHGLAAIVALGDRLPDVAQSNGLDAPGLRRLFLEDSTLAVDANDELLYVDERAPGEAAAEASGGGTAAAPPVTDPVFFLHSRPGADHTIFLDFDGHTAIGTSWNDVDNPSITTGPYNTDGNPDAWSAGELDVIQQSWERVAEDFSPFDVNVTTEDPGADALRRSGGGDQQWGVRVVITPDDWDNCGCGGFAYIGAFDDPTDEPAYVFNSGLSGVSEASSHEVGHTLGLAHDGLASGTTYYQGHGTGEASWAPLMGASYYRSVTQWSRGEYFNANNDNASANYGSGPDDLAIIASLTNGNGFGYRSDDHGDDIAGSTALAGPALSAAGVVERTTDVDVFSFDAGAGAAVIDIDPASNHPNLNVRAELRTASGTLVAVADPISGLDVRFDLSLAAGSYQIVVTGTGAGDPLSSPPTGYTDYASLGQYSVTGSVQPAGPADETPPATPTDLTATATATAIELGWTAVADPDLASYRVYRSTFSGTGYSLLDTVTAPSTVYSDTTAATNTAYHYVVTAADLSGNESGFSDEASAQRSAPDVVTADVVTTYGTVSGSYAATTSPGGAGQTFTETHSGGRPSNRHDRVEHVWALPVTGGNHMLHVVATSSPAGDLDAGRFDISWSTSSSGDWSEPVITIGPGSSEHMADLGTVSGTIYLRLTDRDRTQGNNSNDSIVVHHIYLDGGAPPTAPPGEAGNPMPPNNATGVSTSTTLAWAPGTGATSHQVYFAQPGEALTALGGATAGTSADPGPLAPSTTYYWRVDSINALDTTVGQVWSFTTAAAPVGPSELRVESVSLSTVSAGRGQRHARATVVVVDDQGNSVSQATVTGQFTGDIDEESTAVTNGSGTAVLTSAATAKKPTFDFCVVDVTVTGGLPLDRDTNPLLFCPNPAL